MARDFSTCSNHKIVRLTERNQGDPSVLPIHAPQKLCVWIVPVPFRLNRIIHGLGGTFDWRHDVTISFLTDNAINELYHSRYRQSVALLGGGRFYLLPILNFR